MTHENHAWPTDNETSPPSYPDPKPGYRTTEFWLTLATAVVGLLIGYGILTRAEAQLWLALAAALIPALPVGTYAISRALVKRR